MSVSADIAGDTAVNNLEHSSIPALSTTYLAFGSTPTGVLMGEPWEKEAKV